MSHFHAVVWLDHRNAHVFHVNSNVADEIDVVAAPPLHAAEHGKHLHHHAGDQDGKRAPEDQAYYHAVVAALGDAREWLVVGPGSAKLELVKHIHHHDTALSDRLIGVETVDHPTDKQLLAYARTYFRAADRLRPQ